MEAARKKELDKAWDKRLEVWGKEQEAREKLLAQVLTERKHQVAVRLEQVKVDKQKQADARIRLEAELAHVNAIEAAKTREAAAAAAARPAAAPARVVAVEFDSCHFIGASHVGDRLTLSARVNCVFGSSMEVGVHVHADDVGGAGGAPRHLGGRAREHRSARRVEPIVEAALPAVEAAGARILRARRLVLEADRPLHRRGRRRHRLCGVGLGLEPPQ